MEKFKIGQKVKAHGGPWLGEVGKIESIIKPGTQSTNPQQQWYWVNFGGHNSFKVFEDWLAANSTTNPVVQNALAAMNTNFKVGDRVRFDHFSGVIKERGEGFGIWKVAIAGNPNDIREVSERGMKKDR